MMKQAILILALLLPLAFTSCNNSDNDKTMYLQAQMVNHVENSASDDSQTITSANAVVYDILLDTDKGKANVACQITLPDGKIGTMEITDLAMSVDANTGGYYLRQTTDSRSRGTYAATEFSGVIDLSQSGISQSHFSFVVEKHYQVNATIAELVFSGKKAEIKTENGGVRTLSGGKIVIKLNPTYKSANVEISGLDYDESLGTERTLTYENLTLTPCFNGYEITASSVAPSTGGDMTLNKYKLDNFKAKIEFFNNLEATYTISNIGEVTIK